MLAILLLAVSLVGLWLSIHATALGSLARWPDLMATRYARVFGVRNSVVAAAYFVGLVAFAIDRLLGSRVLPIGLPLAASALSLLTAAYLGWALFVRLQKF